MIAFFSKFLSREILPFVPVIQWFFPSGSQPLVLSFWKKILFIYFYRREGREKGRERNINVWLPLTHPLLGTWPTSQACALTGNWTCNPLIHSPVLNPLTHTRQGLTSYTLLLMQRLGTANHVSILLSDSLFGSGNSKHNGEVAELEKGDRFHSFLFASCGLPVPISTTSDVLCAYSSTHF